MEPVKKIAIVLLILCSGSAWAKSAYVTDQVEITLRTGASTSHRIVRMLPTGEKLTVLSTDAQSGYSKIRTASGVEGFVLSRQLVDEPVARDRLAAAEAEVAALKAAPGELRSRLTQLTEQHAALTKENEELKQAKSLVDQEYAALQRTANNAVRIANERNELRKQVAELTREIEDVKQQNRELENKTAQNWFLIGAGVVVGGILLGLILPHLRVRRRKSSWGSL
ncbi:MAG: TIGR04211 family SH3 domain-containing protein [Gammaproteobacteria bacterium]|nr:TIGR04211 family SH3 domain-containing protein [Gammaproteobacteria bacterium]MCB1924055.1 TIGR04211 family SH3 domain-containing protein [Gammaproteobacteria bacterium]